MRNVRQTMQLFAPLILTDLVGLHHIITYYTNYNNHIITDYHR